MNQKQFKPTQSFNFLSWNCSIVYLVTGYILAIPSTSEVSWNILNKTFYNYYINSILQQYAFVFGAILSLGLEIKGNLRTKITKCDVALCVVFLLHPFTPFAAGTLIIRFIQGAILSLNIRYSEKYLYYISQPIYLFSKWENQENPYFGLQQFSKFTVNFYTGWAMCALFGAQLPQSQNLIYIKNYDDTLLWYLLNSFPMIFIAFRIINLNITFPFNTIVENQRRQDLNEYYVANVFKKRYVEAAWEMLYAYKLEQIDGEIEVKNPILITAVAGQLCGSMLLVVYSYELIQLIGLLQNNIVNVQMFVSTIGLLGALLARYCLNKVPLEVIYILSLIGSFMLGFSYIIFKVIDNPNMAILSLLGLSVVNGLGISNIGYSINYYVQTDDSFVLKLNLVRWLSLLLLLVFITFLGIYVIYTSIIISLILCFYFCNSFSGLISSLQNNETQEMNEIAPQQFDDSEEENERNQD